MVNAQIEICTNLNKYRGHIFLSEADTTISSFLHGHTWGYMRTMVNKSSPYIQKPVSCFSSFLEKKVWRFTLYIFGTTCVVLELHFIFYVRRILSRIWYVISIERAWKTFPAKPKYQNSRNRQKSADDVLEISRLTTLHAFCGQRKVSVHRCETSGSLTTKAYQYRNAFPWESTSINVQKCSSFKCYQHVQLIMVWSETPLRI